MAIEFQDINENLSLTLKKKKLKDWVDDIQDYMKDSLECDELDRKFASQAIAFVIKHSRKGVVSLCTAVATLLQEKYRLQVINKKLQKKLLNLSEEPGEVNLSSSSLPHSEENSSTAPTSVNGSPHPILKNRSDNHVSRVRNHSSNSDDPVDSQLTKTPECLVENGRNIVTTVEVHSPPPPPPGRKIKQRSVKLQGVESDGSVPIILAPCPLQFCICQRCKQATNDDGEDRMFAITYDGRPILEEKDIVVTKDDHIGIVQYIGHLDGSDNKDAVYVRLKVGRYDNANEESSIKDVLLNDIRCVLGSSKQV